MLLEYIREWLYVFSLAVVTIIAHYPRAIASVSCSGVSTSCQFELWCARTAVIVRLAVEMTVDEKMHLEEPYRTGIALIPRCRRVRGGDAASQIQFSSSAIGCRVLTSISPGSSWQPIAIRRHR